MITDLQTVGKYNLIDWTEVLTQTICYKNTTVRSLFSVCFDRFCLYLMEYL